MHEPSASAPKQPVTPDPGSATPIDTDLPCVTCGYNLRSLDRHGRCPECGHPVAESIRSELMRFAHPAWVRKLAWGATELVALALLLPRLGINDIRVETLLLWLLQLISLWATMLLWRLRRRLLAEIRLGAVA